MSKVASEIIGGIAVIELENPPVNSLGHELRVDLLSALALANADASVQAIVMLGSGAVFSGGADIREFGTPKAIALPNLLTLIREIEAGSKPVVAAWLLLYIIPLVNIVIAAIVAMDIAKSFGQSAAWGFVLLFLFCGIGYLILGFGSSRYLGPAANSQALAAA